MRRFSGRILKVQLAGLALLLLFLCNLVEGANPTRGTIEQVQFHLDKADALPRKTSERSAELKRAYELLAPALEKEKPAPAELFWWLAAYGEWIQEQSRLTALSAIGELEKNALRLLAIDPAFEHSAADRILGKLYLKAPGIISIGSNAKAKKHFEAAMQRDPYFIGNLTVYAEFQADQGNLAEAKRLALEAQGLLPRVSEWEQRRCKPIIDAVLLR